jgi:CBS domain containing-hemolysin-like protein
VSATPLLATGFRAQDIILLIVIAVLLAGSGVLAMAETSLVRMTRIKAKSLVDQKKRGAKQLARLVENPANFLNPILLLVLICQLVSATLVGIVAAHLFGGLGVLLGIVFEVVVIFVFFEAVPKNWAVHQPERAALISAPIVSTLIRFPPIHWISSILIGLANRIIGASGDGEEGIRPSYITDSELKAMADVAHDENVIESEERSFIHSIIDFGDTVAREVMTPRPDMVTVEADVTVREALEAALAAGYSRIPVEQDGIDDIIGIAYAKDLVRAERSGKAGHRVRDAMRPAKFIPESKEVSDLLREMQEEKFHMAIVVDEYGGTAGVVTLEDLLEELVGDIVDEFDIDEPRVERAADGSVLVPAVFSVDDVDDLLDAELPRGTWDTVGGLMLDLMGRVPDNGDSVIVDGFRLTAVEVRGRRIGRVRIEPTRARTAPFGEDEAEDEGSGDDASAPAPAPAPTGVRPATNGGPERRDAPGPDARTGPGPRARPGEAPTTGG